LLFLKCYCDFVKRISGGKCRKQLICEDDSDDNDGKKGRQTYLQETTDLSVVRSITTNELVVAILESGVLNHTGVVELQVVIVLIKTTRADDTTDWADVRSRSSVDTSSMMDALDLSSGTMTTVAVEAAIDAATTRAVLEVAVLVVDVASCFGVLTVSTEREIIGDLVESAGTRAPAVYTASGGARSVIATVNATGNLARLRGSSIVTGLIGRGGLVSGDVADTSWVTLGNVLTAAGLAGRARLIRSNLVTAIRHCEV
jgi:hypothetical protein